MEGMGSMERKEGMTKKEPKDSEETEEKQNAIIPWEQVSTCGCFLKGNKGTKRFRGAKGCRGNRGKKEEGIVETRFIASHDYRKSFQQSGLSACGCGEG
jgi:hypothetical protein